MHYLDLGTSIVHLTRRFQVELGTRPKTPDLEIFEKSGAARAFFFVFLYKQLPELTKTGKLLGFRPLQNEV